jgi:hypothetical protein
MNYPYTKIKCSATSYVNPIDKGKKPIYVRKSKVSRNLLSVP